MSAVQDSERLISRIVGAATEAISLDEIGREVLPLFERLLSSSKMLLYRSQENSPFLPVAGAAECLPEYVAQFAAQDPFQHFLNRKNPTLVTGTRCDAWREFRQNSALVDFYERWDLSWFLHLRLSETRHMEPGHVAIVCGRAARQRDFDHKDLRLVKAVRPSLSAALRRAGRISQRLATSAAVETLFKSGQTRAVLALDLSGRLLWISPTAERLLAPYLGAGREMPPAILAATRRLAILTRDGATSLTRLGPFQLVLENESGEKIEGEIYLQRNNLNEPIVTVDLGGDNASPSVLETARRHHLTRAETEILSDLVAGRRDAEIASQRFVSVATVRTHVSRIIQKLGVRSRLQAAALTLGTSQPLHGRQERPL